MNSRVLQVDSRDNVLVALTNLSRGETVEHAGKVHSLISDVPAKHKFATMDLAPGDRVVMYGGVVGNAVKPIRAGELLTTSNIRHEATPFHEQKKELHWQRPNVSRWADRTFQGFVRPDGQVGTRNYWLVVPLVFCENKNIQVLKQAFEEELGFAAPQVYRRQVAELAKLYREGKTCQTSRHAALDVARLRNLQALVRKCRWHPFSAARRRLRRDSGGFQQSLRTALLDISTIRTWRGRRS